MSLRRALVPLLVLLCSLPLYAQTDKQTADQQAAMAAWQKFMTPGSGQKALEAMAGTFDAKVSSWMTPGADPMVSSGVSENSMILGGRYLQEKFTGTFMGQPFEGIGYTGYDNGKKQYVSTWIDNMGTGVMISNGTASGTNGYKFTGTATDPMTGKDSPVQTTVTVADTDHHTMEMWGPGPDGKVYKMMQIDYTRKK